LSYGGFPRAIIPRIGRIGSWEPRMNADWRGFLEVRGWWLEDGNRGCTRMNADGLVV